MFFWWRRGFLHFWIRILWFTVSNALVRSINTVNVGVALFSCMNISSVVAAIVDTVKWFLLNPPWSGFRRWCTSRYAVICVCVILSIIFNGRGNSAIGPKLVTWFGSPFFRNGVILACFHALGMFPVLKLRFIKWVNCVYKQIHLSFRTLVDKLPIADDLLESIWEHIYKTSCSLVPSGVIISSICVVSDLLRWWLRWWKFVWELQSYVNTELRWMHRWS